MRWRNFAKTPSMTERDPDGLTTRDRGAIWTVVVVAFLLLLSLMALVWDHTHAAVTANLLSRL